MPERLKVMIIEDEPLPLEDLKFTISMHPNLQVQWEAGSIAETIRLLSDTTPDVVFLDIMLEDGTGFDLLPHFSPDTAVIFVTAFEQYAVRAFEVNALDYLLKPVSDERLDAAVRKLVHPSKNSSNTHAAQPLRYDDSLYIRTRRERRFISLTDILMIRYEGGNYTTFLLDNGESPVVRATLDHWETRLPHAQFIRIHRTTIVNIQAVRRFWHEKGGKYFVALKNVDEPIRVSRGRAGPLGDLLDRRYAE